MFEIIFYKDKSGRSRIVEYLDDLQQKMLTNKDARINREKILVYLEALARYGVAIGRPYIKHIEGIYGNCGLSETGFFSFFGQKIK